MLFFPSFLSLVHRVSRIYGSVVIFLTVIFIYWWSCMFFVVVAVLLSYVLVVFAISDDDDYCFLGISNVHCLDHIGRFAPYIKAPFWWNVSVQMLISVHFVVMIRKYAAKILPELSGSILFIDHGTIRPPYELKTIVCHVTCAWVVGTPIDVCIETHVARLVPRTLRLT